LRDTIAAAGELRSEAARRGAARRGSGWTVVIRYAIFLE